jgi:perosamine synthetase
LNFEYTYYRGRVALFEILSSLGIGKGDNVAIQAFTCVAVPEGVMATGAKPLWIDIESGNVNMCPDSLESRITPETKAIVVQHTFGIPVDIKKIINIANNHSLPVIEDCCHTINSTIAGKKVGTWGVAAFYSFEWGKPLIVGIGGAAKINDAILEKEIKKRYKTKRKVSLLKQYKLNVQYFAYSILYNPKSYWKIKKIFRLLSKLGIAEGNYNDLETISSDYNLKMSDKFEKRLKKKSRTQDDYDILRNEVVKYFKKIYSESINHIQISPGNDVYYARYPVYTDRKDEILSLAEKSNIEIAGWYSTPIYPFNENEWKIIGYKKGDCPHAEVAAQKVISFPLVTKNHKTYIKKLNQVLELM